MNPSLLSTARTSAGTYWSDSLTDALSTNLIRYQQIISRLARGKEYRESFVENEITVGVPFQIRAMREDRGWTQKDLGERTGKRQSVISQLESPGYGKLTLTSLRVLADAFDVGLMVRFVPFSELAWRGASISVIDHAVPSFRDDAGVHFSFITIKSPIEPREWAVTARSSDVEDFTSDVSTNQITLGRGQNGRRSDNRISSGGTGSPIGLH